MILSGKFNLRPWFGLFFTFILAALVSCESSETGNEIGIGLVGSETWIELIDTFSISTSTVRLDSMITSGDDSGLAGRLWDDMTGEVRAESYFRLEWPSSGAISSEEWCDSVCLILKLSGYKTGDTTETVSLLVHEVTSDYELPESGYFYNHHSLKYSSEPVGSLVFNPGTSDTLISVPMNRRFGERIFNILKNRDYTVDENESLQEYLKGLVLRTENTQNLIFGLKFDDFTCLKLYIGLPSQYGDQREISLGYSNSNEQFNHIETSFAGSAFSGLESMDEMSSATSMSRNFVQPAANIFTRISFLSLESLLQISEYGTVLSAELLLYPAAPGEQANSFPADLVLYRADKYFYPVEILTNSEGATISPVRVRDIYYNEFNYYSFDISLYILDELKDNYIDPEKSLLLSIGDENDSPALDKLILKGSSDRKYKPVLRVLYLHF